MNRQTKEGLMKEQFYLFTWICLFMSK